MHKQFEEKYEHSFCTNIWTINFNRSINLNRFINNQFERHYQQLTKKSTQPTWTDISTINLNKKWTINLNKNMSKHFEQKNVESIWFNIWTMILNKILNNQFEEKYQFGQKYQKSIWTELSKFNKKTNINTQFEQKYRKSILNKIKNNHFEQKCQFEKKTWTSILNTIFINQFD